MAIFLLFLSAQDAAGLVEKLSEGTPEKRWRAVEGLAAMGPGARAALARCRDSWWKRIAVAELDAAQEAQGRQHRARRVTIRIDRGAAGEALRSLARQAGIPIEADSLPEGKVTLQLRDATYFEALVAIGLQGDVDLMRFSESAYEPVADPGAGRFACTAGPFLVRAKRVLESTRVSFEKDPYTTLSLDFSLRPEPGLPVLTMENPELVLARDDSGRALGKRSGTTYGFRSIDRSRKRDRDTREFRMDLDAPGPRAKKIALLRGFVRLLLPLEEKTIAFDDPKPGKEIVKSAGPITVVLKEFKESRDTFQVRLDVRVEAPLAHWPKREDFVLSDEIGTAYRSWGSSTSWGGKEGRVHLTFRNPGGAGTPKRLTGRFVTRTYHRTVHFELKDLPLP